MEDERGRGRRREREKPKHRECESGNERICGVGNGERGKEEVKEGNKRKGREVQEREAVDR